MNSKKFALLLTLGCVGLQAPGCAGKSATVAGQTGTNLRSLFQPRVSQLAADEPVDEIPAKPKDEYLLRLRFAEWMEDAGKTAEAEKQYQQIVAAKPKNVGAVLGLVRMDILAGRMQEAEEGLRRAQKIARNSPEVAATYGHFYAANKKWDEAAESYQKALKAKPDDENIEYQLALALTRGGKVDAALPHFSKTVGEAAGHYNAALILRESGELSEAERHLKLALQKNPDLSEAKEWMVTIRREQGKLPRESRPSDVRQVSASSEDFAGEPATLGSPALGGQPVSRNRAVTHEQAEQLRNQQ